MDLIVTQSGMIRCIYDETIELLPLGTPEISRGSHVEPTRDGLWTADLSPVAGPLLGPFPQRSAALTAEQDWLNQHWLLTGR
ncbi:hypothetical protein [Gimesia maris]|uniref:Uncharacterized protein n=1 Tax=Gimesia maris TaxID=122 RepID=A0ABX5YP35_9PLAN|nr:hypothetical protein [Gimesia maris]QEG17317.1 hypothetical protein GmarT_31970 [Gimesia maris]QGQ29588.1 hypothetical protein F1729_13525 [Gimesia maris]